MEYDLWQLVSSRSLDDFSQENEQLICDIDKTYLETNFESFVQLIQIPFEKARHKVTVAGAKEIVQAFRQPPNASSAKRPVHFVSSSPPQLREVLSNKLVWDGLTWSSDTFKNQAYNLRKGQLNNLRRQIAYKSAAILNIVTQTKLGTSFHMLGDNAESDAIIYLGIKLFVEAKLSKTNYLHYLNIVGVPKREALQIFLKTDSLDHKAGLILIRQLPGYKLTLKEPLTDPIILFDNYFEAFLLFLTEGIIDGKLLTSVAKAFHNYYGINSQQMVHYLKLLPAEMISPELSRKITNLEEEASWGALSDDFDPRPLLERKSLEAFNKLSQSEILDLATDWKKSLGR